jgi:hypothetical protein
MKTFTEHHAAVVAARERLEEVGQFKPSYLKILTAFENTLLKCAAGEGTVIERIKKKLKERA